MAEEKKKGFRLHALNPMVLLGIIMFLAFLASYIVPAGEYSRVMNPVLNKEVVDPATFHYIQQQPVRGPGNRNSSQFPEACCWDDR